jgi:hypothetical protein
MGGETVGVTKRPVQGLTNGLLWRKMGGLGRKDYEAYVLGISCYYHISVAAVTSDGTLLTAAHRLYEVRRALVIQTHYSGSG